MQNAETTKTPGLQPYLTSRIKDGVLYRFNESDLFIEDSPFSPIEKEIIVYSTDIISGKIFTTKKAYEITIPSSISKIGQRAFAGANKYPLIINVPESVTVIDDEAFYQSDLYQINLPDSITRIGPAAFFACHQLKSINLPNALTTLERCLFNNCSNLSKVELGENIKHIKSQAFYHCAKLNSIDLPEGLESIDAAAFEECSSLKTIILPESLESIGNSAFESCKNLKSINIPPKVTTIPHYAFRYCSSLENISMHDNIKNIGQCAFFTYNNSKIKSLTIPDSALLIGHHALHGIPNINIFGKEITDEQLIKNLGEIYFFLRYASSHNKFIPHIDVMTNTPDIDVLKFYQHQKDWKEVLDTFHHHNKITSNNPKTSRGKTLIYSDDDIPRENSNEFPFIQSPISMAINNIVNPKESDETIGDLYSISYALGLLEHGKTSERAKAFIKENICTMTANEIHTLYNGINIRLHEFIPEFADFYITNYHKPTIINGNIMGEKKVHFLEKYKSEADTESITNYTAQVYNQWKSQVKKALPNRAVLPAGAHASENNSFTEDNVINAVITKIYTKVLRGNEKMADMVGKYGYTQQDFETLQEWYEISKKISDEDLILTASPDDNEHDITYELLDKQDPTALILGEITNCCQTINKVGKTCLRYGLTQPNSGFVKFTYGDSIIAQSWVWYNPDTRTVCLDNIEVPTIWQKKMKNKIFELRFKDCISRLAQGLIDDMTQNGYPVDRVTVGDKHNDLRNIMQNFKITEDSDILSTPKDYGAAYSDARELQYVIAVNNRINTINNNTTAIINSAHEIND